MACSCQIPIHNITLSTHLSVNMLVENIVSPAVDNAVSVAAVLFADRPAPPPEQPGPPADDEAPPSVDGCQSPGQQEHGLWSERREYHHNSAV